MMKKESRSGSAFLIVFLVLIGLIIMLIANTHGPYIEKGQISSTDTGIDMPGMVLATNGSDVPDWWVIILILLVVSIIGDIVTIMMILMKKKEVSENDKGSKAETRSSSEDDSKGQVPTSMKPDSVRTAIEMEQIRAAIEPENEIFMGVGAGTSNTSSLKSVKVCPKCGNLLKTEYATCPFCRYKMEK